MKKKRHGFAIFMAIWCILLICAGGFALRYLADYLKEYEKSRPKYVVEAYTEDVISGNISDSSFTVLDKIDSRIQSRQEALSFIHNILSEAKFYKAVNESTDDMTVYRIKNGNSLIGKASMTKTGETGHGFPLWSFTEAEFYFNQYLTSRSVILPEAYSVSVNGTALDSSYITEKGIRYDMLLPFYDTYPEFPTLVKYEAGNILGDFDLTVRNRSGKMITEEEMNEKAFLAECFPCEKENEIREFTSDFTSKYSDYTTNVTGYTTANYSALKSIVVPDSILHNRIRLAFDAMNYVYAKKCSVVSEEINLICEPAEGVYLSDVSYSTETKGQNGEGITDSNIRLIINDYKNDLRASDMSTY